MAAVDAPAIRLDDLSPQQRDGRSCCWCSDWASPAQPVPLLTATWARLRSCSTCAGVYGVPAVEPPR
ncbi:hypothetical protein ACIRPT_24675 [Streptomyces sp. NPDC101227]|uniref:hypothetical protein n=1 Tax=Streptomyces sp. NPDC101227 TaxID=3366136 RepID=UPI0038277482